jgi:hypothetical protein
MSRAPGAVLAPVSRGGERARTRFFSGIPRGGGPWGYRHGGGGSHGDIQWEGRIRFSSGISPCSGPWGYRPWGEGPTGRGGKPPSPVSPGSDTRNPHPARPPASSPAPSRGGGGSHGDTRGRPCQGAVLAPVFWKGEENGPVSGSSPGSPHGVGRVGIVMGVGAVRNKIDKSRVPVIEDRCTR